MKEKCPRGFDEALFSGYLDGELTQADEQLVRIHLEDCDSCRNRFEAMKGTREVTMSTRFVVPRDDQWKELPRTPGSALARGLGWVLLIVWFMVMLAYGLWQFLTGPDGLFEKLLVFGVLTGLGLLFLSVLMDRIRAARTDRYREVER